MKEDTKHGVYYHPIKGFAITSAHNVDGDWWEWEIDKNKIKAHFLLRVSFPEVLCGTGSFFFYKNLKGYEYLGEL